ncbi:hypothetical protein NSS60_12975 [Anoxybacillus sp. FSL W8-0382]|nr:hypothetical protein [Anoxybacillus flavithermus]
MLVNLLIYSKIFIAILAGVFGLSSVFMIGVNLASATSNNTPIVQKETSTATFLTITPTIQNAQITQQQVQPYGIKGFLVKQAIKIIKAAIDKGGDVLNYILKWFDEDTAKYFNNNKSKVVEALDDLESWIDDANDLAQSTIKTKLNSLLIEARVPGTYSLLIADAIARTITWLIL